MFVHEDNRRRLIEWATGNFKECKVAEMKADGVLGNHWHANKDEVFLLLSGEAEKIVVGEEIWLAPKAPFRCEVPRGVWHEFHLKAGAVLLGAATELFDKQDENTDRDLWRPVIW